MKNIQLIDGAAEIEAPQDPLRRVHRVNTYDRIL